MAKNRKDRVLSFDDITHYRTLCTALAETKRRMAEVDDMIEAHGGWPATFQAVEVYPKL